MKIGWLSDIHLSFLENDEVSSFIGRLASVEVDSWVISGDIGESDDQRQSYFPAGDKQNSRVLRES